MSKRKSLKDRDEETGISRAVSAFVSNITESENDTNIESKVATKNDTKTESENDTMSNEKEKRTRIQKKISVGVNLQIDNQEEKKRIPYELKLSTIEKINIVSKLTKKRKYELVDLILSSVCDEIIKKSN